MAGSSEPAFSFEYKKGAIAPWMITHLFCNSPTLLPVPMNLAVSAATGMKGK